MKNITKKLVKIGLGLGIFAGGFLVGELQKDSHKIVKPVQAETVATIPTVQNSPIEKEGYNISTIPNNENNIFVQYFTVDKIENDTISVHGTYFDKDVQEFDKKDFSQLHYEVGTKLAFTYNHDKLVSVNYDTDLQGIYKVDDSIQYFTDFDSDQFIQAINVLEDNDKILLDKNDFKNGDIVKVQFMPDGDEVDHAEKIGGNSQKVEPEKEVKKEVKKEQKEQVKQESQEKNIPAEKPKNEQPKTQNAEKVKNENTEKAPKVETQKTEQKQENKTDYTFLEKDDKRKNSVQNYKIIEDSSENLINAENVNNPNEKYILENKGYKKGDIIEVTFGDSGFHDDIVKQVKK